MKTRTVTRLKEDFIHMRRGQWIVPRMDDYEMVPLLETRGVYPIAEAIPMEQRITLQVWRDKKAGVKKRK